MSDGSSLPTENLRSSLLIRMFFFSVNIPVPRKKFKNEAESWDVHHARLRRKSAREVKFSEGDSCSAKAVSMYNISYKNSS